MSSCHGGPAGPLGRCDVRIALAGNPNVGKSSLFNALTGSTALVANYPGKTVELQWGTAEVSGKRVGVVDLPGCYSLDGASEDQRLAAEVLRGKDVDVVVLVVDAGNLPRNLFLTLQTIALGRPAVVALNLVDLAEAAGRRVDAAKLSAELGVPVVPTVASKGERARELLETAVAAAGPLSSPAPAASADELHRRARETARKATTLSGNARRESRWWLLTTTPRTGLPILIGVLLGIFSFVYFVGSLLSTAFSTAWTAMVSPPLQGASFFLFGGNNAPARVFLWGFDSGINATLAVGIPYVLTFYAILAVMEDSGYLNAAAVLSHRALANVGLHGRAAIPLVSGAGCNVPAVIGTRVLTSRRERFIACTLISLVPCSARTAVVFGAVGLYLGWAPALGVFAVSLAVILLTGVVLNRLLPGEPPAFLLELFPFRRPTARSVAFKTWHRFKHFTFAAVPVVILGSLLLGGLYETGLVWQLSRPLDPVVGGLLGLPAVAGLALVFAFLRKELALQLLVALAMIQYGQGAASLTSFLSRGQLLVYALVTILYVPCLASVVALARELGWRNATVISGITVGLALLVGGIAARLLL